MRIYNLNGRPPEGHSRQCQRMRRTGHRCAKWALTGSNFCQFHGGRHKTYVRNHSLPKFYSKYLTKTLAEAVDEQLGMDSSDQLNLQEELALMRLTCAQAVAMFSAAHETEKDELIVSASLIMREALESVGQMCKDAAAVESSRKDAITPMDLKQIVNQIVRLLYTVCGEDNEHIARRFEERVRDEIKLPSDVKGTTLNPTKDVTDMLSTIPKED